MWLQGLIKELGMKMIPMKLLCDSMSAIYLAKNLIYHKRTKHIDVQYHYIREVIENDIEGGTHKNVAEMLIKPMQVEIEIEPIFFGLQDKRSREAYGWHGDVENGDFAIKVEIDRFDNINYQIHQLTH